MKPKINFKYNIPFIAGYNIDGTIIYIDKRLPKTIPGTGIKVEKYLCVHEEVEQMLEDHFGMKYGESHHLATATEHTSLVHDGYSKYRKEYDEFYSKWTKICRESFDSVPPDLDLDPYIFCKEIELLDKMKAIEPSLLWKGKK